MGEQTIAAFFHRRVKWLRRRRELDPNFPVRQFPDGGLVATTKELLEYVQTLPIANREKDDSKKVAA